jgi:hypothetical protein
MVSFDPDEVALAFTAEHLGADKILWASDYPHPDAKIPGVVAELLDAVKPLPEESQRLIVGATARAFYDGSQVPGFNHMTNSTAPSHEASLGPLGSTEPCEGARLLYTTTVASTSHWSKRWFRSSRSAGSTMSWSPIKNARGQRCSRRDRSRRRVACGSNVGWLGRTPVVADRDGHAANSDGAAGAVSPAHTRASSTQGDPGPVVDQPRRSCTAPVKSSALMYDISVSKSS